MVWIRIRIKGDLRREDEDPRGKNCREFAHTRTENFEFNNELFRYRYEVPPDTDTKVMLYHTLVLIVVPGISVVSPGPGFLLICALITLL